MNEDLALLKESRNQIAVRHGIPPIGALMVNQYGIEWLVDGHLHLRTLATITRRGLDLDDSEDPQDLYPLIFPQNLSPQLTQFIAETDRCTSKRFMPVDTMPALRPKSAHPGSYSIHGHTNPDQIVIFLDAAHVHETILAHEIGHVWIDLVEDCEDYRIFKDLSNTARVFQWTSIQSFVLDMRVNEVLREKGFDMRIIEGHVEEALANISLAILSGYRPPEPREAAFLATTFASAMLDQETGAVDALQSLDLAAMACQRDLPDVYELACQLAASVRKHGYNNRASIRKAIDECASLSFQYVGEPLNFDRDLVEKTPEESYEDKYPQWFPGLPVAAKLEIGKAMARQRVPAGTEWQLSYSPAGSVQIQFRQASGGWTPPVILRHARRLPQDPAFAGRQHAMQKGNPVMNNKPVTSPVSAPNPTMPSFPHIPGRRTYAAGLAVFISRVRLEEQLGGEQPYSYAMNNPVTYIDPDGNQPQKTGGGGQPPVKKTHGPREWTPPWMDPNDPNFGKYGKPAYDCLSKYAYQDSTSKIGSQFDYQASNCNTLLESATDITMFTAFRCIMGCETRAPGHVAKNPWTSDDTDDPPSASPGFGPGRINTRDHGVMCKYGNVTNPKSCANIRDGLKLLCSCLKAHNGDIFKCGGLYNVIKEAPEKGYAKNCFRECLDHILVGYREPL